MIDNDAETVVSTRVQDDETLSFKRLTFPAPTKRRRKWLREVREMADRVAASGAPPKVIVPSTDWGIVRI
ncbi:MAG: hypothetical protein WDA27_14355 [Actinomycetota bacterium]